MINFFVSWQKRAVLFLIFLFSQTALAASFPTPPTPFQYVNDYTKTLHTQEKQFLEEKLAAYAKETSSQIAIVMITTTGDYPISQYAFELGDKWGIGRKGLDNGVLMLVAMNDRKMFIATGQGLEGALPDAFLSQIIRNVIMPEFKQGFYAKGLNKGLDYIIAASKREYEPHQQENSWEDYIPIFMIAVFVLFVLFGELSWRRKPYISPSSQDFDRIIRQSTLSRRRSGGGFSGGFGGGSSSGGGFGGGSFGGGGAGGSW
ncbi:methanol dehydrogenase [Canicola haemoglobinophilus]|uniref:Domain of uncharacterized function (DUF477) n=1 Tax=Canicola haemoglobinophilus TaxID=733 RepID=A0A1V4B3C0_9PAST|nr:methanol dehydrogenase [Canicola haemoglobinophilus]STO60721.1 Domain of uncharacterised function (DUF477) [Canicola haemoglobinophilus]